MPAYPQEARSWIRGVRHVIIAVREKNKVLLHIFSFNPNDKALMLIVLSSPLNRQRSSGCESLGTWPKIIQLIKWEASHWLRSFVFQCSCFCYSTFNIMLSLLGFCQGLQHNPWWLGPACDLWCFSQYCQSRTACGGREGADSVSTQEGVHPSLPSSPSPHCSWLPAHWTTSAHWWHHGSLQLCSYWHWAGHDWDL